MMPWSWIINAAVGAVTVAASVLCILAVLAYRRARRGRFLLVAAAFGVVLVRGIWMIAGLMTSQSWESLLGVASLGDILLVFLLYLAVIR